MGRLSGKVAVVTGAASQAEGVGNGAATAILFAREGARIVLVNRGRDRAEALAERIRSEGGEAAAFTADVTRPEDTEAMAAFAVERFGRLDILHNNVGIGGRLSTPETIDLADWHHVVETNLTSALLCCRSCIPRMRAGGGGAIVNVSSVAGTLGLSGSPGAVAYTTTKAGLQGFTLDGPGRVAGMAEFWLGNRSWRSTRPPTGTRCVSAASTTGYGASGGSWPSSEGAAATPSAARLAGEGTSRWNSRHRRTEGQPKGGPQSEPART